MNLTEDVIVIIFKYWKEWSMDNELLFYCPLFELIC